MQKIPSKKDPRVCGCGKELLSHDLDSYGNNKTINIQSIDNKLTEWRKDTCTLADDYTNAFGECQFIGYNDNLAKYCRIHYGTDIEIIFKLLFNLDYWNLKRPNLIISAVGGSKLTLKKRSHDAFSKRLVNVATTTNSIITSGGSNSGYMKIIGEAFKENAFSIYNKIPLIGICNWRNVSNNYKLIHVNFINVLFQINSILFLK